MAPKKVAAATAVENGGKASSLKEKESKASAEATTAKPKVVKMKSLGHPSTLAMVVEVLKKHSERKGTSVPAIRTRILAAHPTVDPVRLKSLLRSALNKGIEKGILIRPPNSNATGATGRFKLAKPGSKSKKAVDGKLSENVDPNVQLKKTAKPKEGSKKVAKKVSKKPKAEEDSKDENTDVTSTEKEKAPRPKVAASKPKKETAEKSDKAPAPAKKPKSKTPAAEEGEKSKKEPAKKKVEESKKEAKDLEEKSAAKSSKKGKK